MPEKGEMTLTSFFSPFPQHLKAVVLSDLWKHGFLPHGLTRSQNKRGFFTCLQYKSFENTVEKGEISLNEQFFLFPQYFLPVWRTFSIFIEFRIVVCKLFEFGRV